MALLPFTDALIRTSAADPECAALADRHYSRQTKGSPQFVGNGRKVVLRDTHGMVVFAWLYSDPKWRLDGESGYNCTIFRNESDTRASDLILQAERFAVDEWGPGRAFTYVDPRKVPPTMVRGYPVWGFCFYKAGWKFSRITKTGKHLLDKPLVMGGAACIPGR